MARVKAHNSIKSLIQKSKIKVIKIEIKIGLDSVLYVLFRLASEILEKGAKTLPADPEGFGL